MKPFRLFIFILVTNVALAQNHQDVFPNESGTTLLNHLANTYRPETVLGYGPARDFLYGTVYNHNDSLTCVYTGYTVYMNPNADPTSEAYSKGINCEHTYPQSKGATGNAKSDMHHLFPTLIDVNGDRGHLPFHDIVDSQTDNWYYWDLEQTWIPDSNIDAWSELDENNYFEPREDHKGNVARAIFYFYTMYKEQADNADATFFPIQKETLCEWYYQDPVDEKEWDATWQIADRQEDKPNPFVLDCTLPIRSYCSGLGYECITGIDETTPNIGIVYPNIPNPASEKTRLVFSLTQSVNNANLIIVNTLGQIITHKPLGFLQGGKNEVEVDVSGFVTGMYFYFIEISGDRLAGVMEVQR